MRLRVLLSGCFALAFSISNAQTASNGLTKVSNDIRLGGTLTQNTTIDVGASYFFKLSKSSQDYLTVINNGNVGIGTSSPSYLLDVNGAMRVGSLTADPTGANGVLYYNSSANRLKTYVAGSWRNLVAEGIASGDYIQNQTASAQSAGFNINGNGFIGGRMVINATSFAGNEKLRINNANIYNPAIRIDDGFVELYNSGSNSTGRLSFDALTFGNVNGSAQTTITNSNGNLVLYSPGIMYWRDNTGTSYKASFDPTYGNFGASGQVTALGGGIQLGRFDGALNFSLFGNPGGDAAYRKRVAIYSGADIDHVLYVGNSDNTASYFNITNTGVSSFGGLVQLHNSSSDLTSLNGGLFYNSSTNKFRGYQNGAWKNFLMEGDAATDVSLAATQIAYGSASNTMTSNGNFIYDASIGRMTIGHPINGTNYSADGLATINRDLHLYAENSNLNLETRDGDISFKTSWGLVEKMRLTNGGKLLLNTTDQGDFKSQVGGNTYVSGRSFFGMTSGVGESRVNIGAPGGNHATVFMTLENGGSGLLFQTTNYGTYHSISAPSDGSGLNFGATGNLGLIGTGNVVLSANTNTATLNTSGELLINTTDQGDHKLQVGGSGYFSNGVSLGTSSIYPDGNDLHFTSPNYNYQFNTLHSGTDSRILSNGYLKFISSGVKISSLSTSGATKMVVTDQNGLLSYQDIPSISGTNDYIQNQNTAAQTGNFWLNGTGTIGNKLLINTTDQGNYKLQVFGSVNLESNFVGSQSLSMGTGGTLQSNTGYRNIAIGWSNLTAHTSGNGNVAIGDRILQNENSGSGRNVGIGTQALMSLTSGLENVGVGTWTLDWMTAGSYNVGLGIGAGEVVSSGNNNIYIGGYAGNNLANGNNVQNDNIIIGAWAQTTATPISNATVIGTGLSTSLSNVVMLGRSNQDVLIGAPTVDAGDYKLQLNGNSITSGFVDLKTQAAPSTPSTGYGRMYPKTDGKLYWKDDAGTEYDLTSGGGTISVPSNQIAYGTGNSVAGNSNLTFDGSTFAINASNIDPSKYASYKLAVNGNAIFTRIKVKEANNWADYVFEKDYKLPTLKEVEAFIKAHKHLPDVPSAEEVKKEGIDVADNQAVLLKKIEELTLYVIEQNKKIEALSKEVEDLKKSKK